MGTRFGAHFQHPVGAFQDIQVMLDNNQAVPMFHQTLKDSDQPADVMPVQPGGRLVKQDERMFF